MRLLDSILNSRILTDTSSVLVSKDKPVTIINNPKLYMQKRYSSFNLASK